MNEEADETEEGKPHKTRKATAKRNKSVRGKEAEAVFKVAGPLGKTPALATLEKAAAAVGLELEQLANLVIDSGVLAELPKDNLTETFTLADLGKHLSVMMGQMTRAAKPEWFISLSPVQKAAMVVHLRVNGCTAYTVAQEFAITPDKVQDIYNEYIDKVGQNTTNVRLTMIVGQMQVVAERAQQGAMGKNDWGAYWRIQKELMAALQSLGVVDRAIHRTEVVHTLDDRAKENIERLATLRNKQERRRKEISVVASETHDAVPDEFSEDDGGDNQAD